MEGEVAMRLASAYIYILPFFLYFQSEVEIGTSTYPKMKQTTTYNDDDGDDDDALGGPFLPCLSVCLFSDENVAQLWLCVA